MLRGVLERSALAPIYFNIYLSDITYLLKVKNFLEKLLIDKGVLMITTFPYPKTPEEIFQSLQNFKIENKVEY